MTDQYDFYKAIAEFCSKEYGNRIINSRITERQFEKVFWMQFDLGKIHYQDYDEVCFPKVDNATCKFVKDYSPQHEVLNLYINSDLITHFYLHGQMPDGEYYNDDLEISWEEEVECFSLKIERVEDLKDIIDFVSEVASNPKINLVNEFEFKAIKLSELLEDIFVFIPHFSSNLLPYKDFIKKLSFKETNKYFDNLDNLTEDFDFKNYDVFTEEGKNEFSKAHDKLNIPIEETKEIFNSLLEKTNLNYTFQYGDIGYNYNSSYRHFAFGFDDVQYIKPENNLSLSIVFRVNKRTSNLLFYDFIKGTFEGKKMISNFFENKSLIDVEFIKGRFAQIQYALEDRINKATMLAKIKRLLLNEENFKLKNILTRKRLKHINSYYEEQHKLIEIFQNPLPFIIEKAYRDFVKSDEEMKILENGEKLLSILLKTRLLFVLEEYKTFHDNSYENFKCNVQDNFILKKPTDGTFSYLNSILNKIIKNENIVLECFGTFQEKLNSKVINYKLGHLTELRNRAAHPPYDKRNFINSLNSLLPDLIESYRDAMQKTDFLIPISFTNKNKTIIMKAKKLMGFESKFETVNITVSKDEMLLFEADELVAYNTITKKIVPFTTFVDLKIQDEPVYTIGLFDHYENGEAKFV